MLSARLLPASTHSLFTIEEGGTASNARKAAFGVGRVNRTVLGPIASTCTPLPKFGAYGAAVFGSSSRSKLNFTSAAVNSFPLCHLTPLRRKKVYTLPSRETSHRSARSGITPEASGL